MFPENALCLRFHVLSFPWDSLDEGVGGPLFMAERVWGPPLILTQVDLCKLRHVVQ
jgi:hypothetical protein